MRNDLLLFYGGLLLLMYMPSIVGLRLMSNGILPTIYPPVTCLTQNIHPTITRRLPVELVDCVAFFPNFILRPNVLENVRWNNSDLPKSYTCNTCRMVLSAKGANARDTFPEVQILQRVAWILKQCFLGGDPNMEFGGQVSVGNKAQFLVTISQP